MQAYPCKCHETGRVCGGCAASLDSIIDNFDEAEADRAIKAAGLDACAPTLRSRQLEGVPSVSRSGL